MKRLSRSFRSRDGGPRSGFSLIEVMAALCVVLAASMLSFSAGSAGLRALHTARLEAAALAAGCDKMEELMARAPARRFSGQDKWRTETGHFTRIWRVRPWAGYPGLQRLEVSTRWWDEDLVILDLVAVAR